VHIKYVLATPPKMGQDPSGANGCCAVGKNLKNLVYICLFFSVVFKVDDVYSSSEESSSDEEEDEASSDDDSDASDQSEKVRSGNTRLSRLPELINRISASI